MFKTNLENFHITFFEQRFEMNICSISGKSLENAVYPLPEGSMSQNFDLGAGDFYNNYIVSTCFTFQVIKMKPKRFEGAHQIPYACST